MIALIEKRDMLGAMIAVCGGTGLVVELWM